MKQKVLIKVLIGCLVLAAHSGLSAGFFDVFAPTDQKVVIVSDVQKREHALDSLKHEKERLLSSEDSKQELNRVQQDLNKTNELISSYKQKLATASEAEKDYYNTVLNVLNETVQILLDLQLLRQKIAQTLDTHISFIEGYLKDPTFKSMRTEVSAVYSFSDLQRLHHDLQNLKENLKQQKDQLEVAKKELEEARQEATLIAKDLKEKERERAAFTDGGRLGTVLPEEGGWGVAEEARLLDLEIKMLAIKKDWAELTIKDLAYQVGMLNTRVEILNSQLEASDKDLDRVDRSLRVGDTEVLLAQEELVKKKALAANLQAQYSKEIRHLTYNKRLLKEQFEKISEQSKIDLHSPQELDDWNIDSNNYPSELAVYRLGYLNEKIRAIDSQADIFEAKKILEKVKLAADEVLVKLITSWHKISQRNLRSEEDIEKEKTKYVNNKLEAQRIIASYRDKQEIASKHINGLGRALSNLESIIHDVKEDAAKLTEKYTADGYYQIVSMLDHSTKLLNMRIELNRKLTDVYSTIISVEKDILRQVEMVEGRLGKIGVILQRSTNAISWENLRNIGPNLSIFVLGLKNILVSSAKEASLANLGGWIRQQVEYPLGIFYFLMGLLAWILLYFLIKQILLPVKLKIFSLRQRTMHVGIFWGVGLLIVEVLSKHLLSIMIWQTIFWSFFLGIIQSTGLQVLFSLASIPYLCYITYRLVRDLREINQTNDYVIISEAVEERFIWVLSFFLYSTVALIFFREAFLLIAYETDLPKVLSALYSVIIRAAIIFLIGKDELVSVIPTRGAVWDVARNYVLNYYYPLLIGIIAMMVMSDPYILGFSKLVSYIVWGTILTILLLLAARWLQDQVRRMTAYLFFYTSEVGTRERFGSAKTWYGLLIIFSYFLVLVIVIFCLAKIWGYGLPASDLHKWFVYELLVIRDGNEMIPITPKSFAILIASLMLGNWLAWVFEKFVLQRVFSILLVERGAQNTVSIISRYVIAIVVLSIGLTSIKLGGFIIYILGALALGIVWAIKDPVNDFISYFIILLDRTVKIGDYIEVDDKIIGVVRKISPRSVLLRRKNSVSIIVPNSKLINMPVYNWCYTRGFFAFDDLRITVPYSVNTKQVKEILAQVLDHNPNILKNPPPVIRLTEFGEFGFVFLIRGFLSTINVLNQWDILSDIRLDIAERLRKAGIPIAVPMRLSVRSDEIKHLHNLEEPVPGEGPDLIKE